MHRFTVVAFIALLAGCGAKLDEAKEIASRDLLDPDATQFRNMEAETGNCITGELNAKNRMGAYTGFRPFIVDLRKKEVAIAPDRPIAGSEGDVIAETRMSVFEQDCRSAN